MPEFALESILSNRAWLRRQHPFPYVVAENVFKPDFYNSLASQTRSIIDRGLSEKPTNGKYWRMRGYDAYGIGIDSSSPDPLSLFISSSWRDLMCGLFDIGPTPYVYAGSHHHTQGSTSGFIHTDYNPVWFKRSTNEAIQTPSHQACDFRTGAGSLSESEKIEVARAAVVVFFLLNDDWQPGDGGEIGLFESQHLQTSNPAILCPPTNNSLVAFECTPQSFHAFINNKRLPRTSIIMWVHRTMEEADQRFGKGTLERWKI
jgi:2OG-Fe(II) oxygenase superfamily